MQSPQPSNTLMSILSEKSSEHYYRLEALWSYVKKNFLDYLSPEDYTGHGAKHCESIEAILDRLIPVSKKRELNSTEIFVLLCSVFFHDIGMMIRDYEHQNIDFIRETHHIRSREFLLNHYERACLSRAEGFVIGIVCSGHRKEDISQFPPNYPIGNETVRVQYLSSLLRIGDELDISSERAPVLARKLKKISGVSAEHWKLHEILNGVFINPEEWKIKINASPEDPFGEIPIRLLREKVQKELNNIKKFLRAEKLFYDEIETEILKIQYETETNIDISKLENPFKLLDFYGENEWFLFFGRDDEIEELYGKVLSNKITVLFGDSGVGKTSLINAGLTPKLKKIGYTPIITRCFEDPLQSIKNAILQNHSELEDKIYLEFIDFLREVSKVKSLVIIIDQFEEIFTQVSFIARERFITVLSQLLSDSSINAKILFSIRSDFLSELWSIEKDIPEIWKNLFRLERLTKKEAESAIKMPIKKMGKNLEERLASQLIIDLGKNGMYFPPDIQIVCHTLYEKTEDNSITMENYNALGGSEKIISDYFSKYLDKFPEFERELAKSILTLMVTSYGTKNQVAFNELLEYIKSNEDKLRELLEKMINARLIRHIGKDSYEIIHDFFAKHIEETLDEEMRKLKKVQELLRHTMDDWKNFKLYMNRDQLITAYKYRNGIVLNDEQLEHIVRSSLKEDFPFWFWFKVSKEKAFNTLKKLLYDSDKNVRIAAVNALVNIKDERVVELLFKKLYDPDKDVQRASIEALKDINDEKVKERLKKELEDHYGTIGSIYISIYETTGSSFYEDFYGTTGSSFHDLDRDLEDEIAIELLLKKLKDSNENVRKKASKALAKIDKSLYCKFGVVPMDYKYYT